MCIVDNKRGMLCAVLDMYVQYVEISWQIWAHYVVLCHVLDMVCSVKLIRDSVRICC